MREIKFRLLRNRKIVGYEKHSECPTTGTIDIMHSKDGFHWYNISYIENVIDKRYISHDDKEQYTGLKDRNEKEIYEGDIVSHKSRNGGKPIIVEIREGRTIGIYSKSNFIFNLESIELYECKIIGNIHENRELIKGDKT